MMKLGKNVPRTPMQRIDRWIELAGAVLLSLATVSSAWCAYQSARWSGIQSFALAEASAFSREAGRLQILGGQKQAIQVAVFLEYYRAKRAGDDDLADSLLARVEPMFRGAVLAWLATDPFDNPQAPPHPFVMPEYQLPENTQAEERNNQVVDKVQEARAANDQSDQYILLTVIFASVLFFSGISTKFQSRRLKIAVLVLGAIFFVAGISVLLYFPVT